jgi:hypothetical protein
MGSGSRVGDLKSLDFKSGDSHPACSPLALPPEGDPNPSCTATSSKPLRAAAGTTYVAHRDGGDGHFPLHGAQRRGDSNF